MIHLKNFKLYSPSEKEFGEGVYYYISEEGKDFYKSVPEFSDKTTKVLYNNDGVVVALSKDVSTLCPEGMSVYEIKSVSVPRDIDTPGKYRINTETAKFEISPIYKEAKFLSDKKSAIADVDSKLLEKEDMSFSPDSYEGIEDDIKALRGLRHALRKSENSKDLAKLLKTNKE